MAISSYGKTTPTTLGFYTESFPDTSVTKTGLEIEPGVYEYVSNVQSDASRIQVENNDVRALSSATGTLVITTRGTSITATNLNVGMFTNLTYTSVTTFTTTENNLAITHSGTTFVAGGSGGSIATSTDGITWTSRTNPYGSTPLFNISYGNNLFVAGFAAIDPSLATSTDGITWATRNGFLSITGSPTFVNYAGSLWFAGSDATNRISTSTNGITWTTRTPNTNGVVRKVAFGAGLYRTITSNNVDSTSTDGITWTSRGGFTSASDIIFADNKFVVVGAVSGNGLIVTSTDGITWTTRLSGGGDFGWVTYNTDKQFFTAFRSSGVAVSTDGITWTSRAASSLPTITAASRRGTILPIVNGTYWIPRNDPGLVVTSLTDETYQQVTGASPLQFGLTLTPTNSSILT